MKQLTGDTLLIYKPLPPPDQKGFSQKSVSEIKLN